MLIELTPSKALSIESIEINGAKLVSVRQMYKTKNDPQWKPGRQGLTIPRDHSEEVAKKIRVVGKRPDSKFKNVEY